MDGGARLGQFKRASMPCEYALSLAHRPPLAADVLRPPPGRRLSRANEHDMDSRWSVVLFPRMSDTARSHHEPLRSRYAEIQVVRELVRTRHGAPAAYII